MAEPMNETAERVVRDLLAPENGVLTQYEKTQLRTVLAELDRLRQHNAMHGYAAPITFTEDENGHPQPQWPTP